MDVLTESDVTYGLVESDTEDAGDLVDARHCCGKP